MSLMKKLVDGPKRNSRKSVGALPAFLDSLNESEREAAETMLRDQSWSSSEIWEAFLDEGMEPIASSTFRGARIEFLKGSA